MNQNLHCHTVFCDGKHTAEDMVLGAMARGITSLGFSGHAVVEYPNDWCMQTMTLPQYHREIQRLQQKYEGQLDIYLGVEKEHLFPLDNFPYDYVISSVHTLPTSDGYCDVDESSAGLQRSIAQYFDGNPMVFAQKYYELVTQAAKTGDILGHFDLLTKFQERCPIFPVDSPSYQTLALDAMSAVLDTGILIEINTGAIQRGYRTSPYPADFLLQYMAEKKANIILTTDAHCVEGLDFGYDDAVFLVRSHGFSHQMAFTKSGFLPVPL